MMLQALNMILFTKNSSHLYYLRFYLRTTIIILRTRYTLNLSYRTRCEIWILSADNERAMGRAERRVRGGAYSSNAVCPVQPKSPEP